MEKMNYKEFSARVKEKYPEYSNMDDLDLAKRVVNKYPEYDNIDFSEEEFQQPIHQEQQEIVLEKSKGVDWETVFGWSFGIAFVSLFIFIYIFPTILAKRRNVKNKSSIIFLDLCLGWTIIGWISAFIWVHLDKSEK